MQTSAAIETADARVRALVGKRLSQLVFLSVGLTLVFALAILRNAFFETSEHGTRALAMDFRVFWAAARLALAGEPLAVFDLQRLGAEHAVQPDMWMPWLYPPGYLVLVMPLGALSFPWALAMQNLASVVLMALAVRPFVAGSRAVWVAMALAPAYLPTLLIGQNSLIWLAVLLAALAALRAGHWVLAGIFIGCLTLKPQLGLMIPFALLGAGLWRTIFAATLTALLLAALPTLAFGPDYWPLLGEKLSEHTARLLDALQWQRLMVGPIYLLALAGLPAKLALAVQWILSALLAGFLVLLWRSRLIGFDAKAAGLLIAILLTAPYLWYYEAAMLAAIGLFFVRAGILGASPVHRVLLVLLWSGTGFQAMSIFLRLGDGRLFGAGLVTPLLLISLALLLRHYHAARPAAGTTGLAM